MAAIINPHDRFFRYVFAHTDWTQQFLATVLPHDLAQSIELSTLQVETGSFIDDELREHFSDLLFSTKLTNGHTRLWRKSNLSGFTLE